MVKTRTLSRASFRKCWTKYNLIINYKFRANLSLYFAIGNQGKNSWLREFSEKKTVRLREFTMKNSWTTGIFRKKLINFWNFRGITRSLSGIFIKKKPLNQRNFQKKETLNYSNCLDWKLEFFEMGNIRFKSGGYLC